MRRHAILCDTVSCQAVPLPCPVSPCLLNSRARPPSQDGYQLALDFEQALTEQSKTGRQMDLEALLHKWVHYLRRLEYALLPRGFCSGSARCMP